MHFKHILAVVAEDEADARQLVEEFLSSYGDGKVWDWYAIGGRWQGSLDGVDVLKYSEKPEVFKAAVEGAVKSIDREFVSLVRKMSGRETRPEEIEDPEIPGYTTTLEQRQNAARRATSYDQAISKNLAKVAETEDRHQVDFMAAYYVSKIGEILQGEYGSAAYFYDVDAYTTDTAELFKRVEEDPEHQFLVCVDLHN